MLRSLDRIDETDPTSHLGIKWWLTNRLGSYAIGAAVGLLVAAVVRPVRRVVVLNSMIERLAIDEQAIDLSTFHFADFGLLHPAGRRHFTRFQTSTTRSAQWTWCCD